MEQRLITFFQPRMYGNGLDRFTINLAQAFVEFGFQIDLVVPEITEYHQNILPYLPTEVRSITLGVSDSEDTPIKKISQLSQYFRRTKPAIFLANADYIGISNAARILAGTSTPIFHVVHIHVSQYFQGFTGKKAKVRPILLKQFYELSDGVIAVSKGVADDLTNHFKLSQNQVHVIHNPVVTPDLFVKAQEPVNHPWFAPDQPPVILGAGRLMPQKDFSTLIRAFAKVRQKRPCRLMILGEWSEHKVELDALIRELQVEDDVALPGFVYNPYAYMQRASVFAMSSRYEGFGNVLAEAMAVGTPVVSTDCESGPAEILDYGTYGCLVPVEDADAMADSILQTLAQPLSPNILQIRAAEFSSHKVAKQYLNHFKPCL